jgi:hypothetical protein
MPAALAASIIDLVRGLTLGPADPEPGNRVSLEGLTSGSRDDGTLEIGIRKIEAASLRMTSGPFMLEVGQLALHKAVALVRIEGGKPRLCALEAASAELSAVKVQGPLILWGPSSGSTEGQSSADSWCLGPLAAADGRIRANIIDAHLLFDADVTVTLRQGQVDFNEATVEHVGPDSRMGASRLGIYVDAPNGRSYLYQFSSPPVLGVQYERPGALPGPWFRDRGSLRLQAFGEWLLRHIGGGQAQGLTEQARQLFDRTAVSGDVQLSDGRLAVPGVQADVVGRADGRNLVRLHSEAVGRGLSMELASLSARNAKMNTADAQLNCDEIAGALMLRLLVESAEIRFALDLANLKVSGVRLQLHGTQTFSRPDATMQASEIKAAANM